MAGVPGRSGRPLKPAALKDLAGNPGKRKRRSTPETFAPLTGAEAPAHLHPIAKIMWETVCELLCSKGVICITDLVALEVFCIAYKNMRLADEAVNSMGILIAGAQGGHIKNPALTATNEAMGKIASFGGMLGLDPASRQRVIGLAMEKEKNQFSSL